MTSTHGTTDTTGLASAIEARDVEKIISSYAEDAELTLLDRDHPPSDPQVLSGRAAIGAHYRDVCGRNMEHQVRDLVSTPTGLAYTQHCRYPDGNRVLCATVATVQDGLIVRQTAVQTWDD